MEYTEDADRRELLLHSAYDSDTVRAMERPLLDKGVPLMRMAAQAAAHMAAGMLDDEDLALEDTSIVLLAGAGDNGGAVEHDFAVRFVADQEDIVAVFDLLGGQDRGQTLERVR